MTVRGLRPNAWRQVALAAALAALLAACSLPGAKVDVGEAVQTPAAQARQAAEHASALNAAQMEPLHDLFWLQFAAPENTHLGLRPREAALAKTPPDASAASAASKSPAALRTDLLQTGRASWYGDKFHGRLTASGERYSMHAMTAAHRTLPFGTKVCVRGLLTGREVLVRINDRGPFAGKRIIDLSRRAASELGMLRAGLTDVALWIPEKDEIANCGDGRAVIEGLRPAASQSGRKK